MNEHNDQIISVEELEKRYKTVRIRTEETRTWNDNPDKRYVVDLIHDGSIYYVHIEFSSFGTIYSGDMGEFMFQYGYRENVFKGSHVNPGYWAQKIDAANRGYFEKEIDVDAINKSFKDYVLRRLYDDLTEEYFESAKKAIETSEADFEKWKEETIEKDEDDEEFAKNIENIREAGKPSDYMDYESYEMAVNAVSDALDRCKFSHDIEDAISIADDGVKDNYRFLYACCVLQWVANKIFELKKEGE